MNQNYFTRWSCTDLFYRSGLWFSGMSCCSHLRHYNYGSESSSSVKMNFKVSFFYCRVNSLGVLISAFVPNSVWHVDVISLRVRCLAIIIEKLRPFLFIRCFPSSTSVECSNSNLANALVGSTKRTCASLP